MILHPRTRSASRRSAFTLLEVLVVVAIILVLASVATVAVLQIQEDNKADTAKMNATTLANAVKMYSLRNDGNPPANIQDILPLIDGNDPNKLIDPWGQQYQIGSLDTGTGTPSIYVFTINPKTGEEIRSDTKR